ncbi:MAG TPA: hypothetical protein PLX97_00785 [Gemmatales bacterium]|nr:hypothetical protein [Gemmatales bacterium]
MNLAKPTSNPVVVIKSAVIYGITAMTAAGLFCFFMIRPDELKNLEVILAVGLGLIGPLLAMTGGLLALRRPTWGGWVYLAGGLTTLGMGLWVIQTSPLAALLGLAILVLFALPMLLIAVLLLTKSRSATVMVIS